jgi:plastocyanin
MQPAPTLPAVDAHRVPSPRGRPTQGVRTRGLALAAITTAGLLLLAIAPASAATVDRSWRARVGASGANGAVTVVAYTTDAGAATLRLKSLPASTLTAVTLRAGTCAKPGTVAATLAPARSSSAGALNGTRSLTKAAVARLRSASSLIATIRAGSFARCSTLARLAVPSPSPSSSPSPDTAGLKVTAVGFAFSPASLTVDAGRPFTVTFRNDDAGVPHGIAVGTSVTATPLFSSTIITGKASETFIVPGLTAGTYVFYCPVHKNMKGTLTVGGIGSTSSPSTSPSTSSSPASTASAEPTEKPSATAAQTPPPTPEPTPTYSY